MTEWDGRGLPPVAAERVRRAAAGGPWTSLLTVPAAVGLAAAGFDPVGEVMGSIVLRIGWQGFRGCGGSGFGGIAQTITSGGSSRFVGYGPYVAALEHGYRTALGRMALEASAIGADGIVGVALSVDHHDGAAREFAALGTAVRARSGTRPSRLFLTHLSGQDVAKLVRGGWMPVDLVFGLSVAIRHDDWRTSSQTSWLAGNAEVDGYTQLVSHTRAEARHRFAAHVAQTGADGAIVDAMSLNVQEIEPSENHRDHIAEASVFGTALVRFASGPAASARPLTYLPL